MDAQAIIASLDERKLVWETIHALNNYSEPLTEFVEYDARNEFVYINRDFEPRALVFSQDPETRAWSFGELDLRFHIDNAGSLLKLADLLEAILDEGIEIPGLDVLPTYGNRRAYGDSVYSNDEEHVLVLDGDSVCLLDIDDEDGWWSFE